MFRARSLPNLTKLSPNLATLSVWTRRLQMITDREWCRRFPARSLDRGKRRKSRIQLRLQLSSRLKHNGNGAERVRQSIRPHQESGRFHTGALIILAVVRHE